MAVGVAVGLEGSGGAGARVVVDEKIEEMLQLSGAGKRFGQKLLFEDVNWLITPDERTGLVGGNGTGKSTLLKVLAGMETLDYGQLTRVQGHDAGVPAAGWAGAARQDGV